MPRFPVIFSILLILLLSASQQTIAARRPLQQDALSNSNGCLDTIPKCERGACATRNIMGVARWVCLRCLSNYEPVVDASGQDNILQCVCPRGTYEPSPNATSCLRCPKDAFCSGGDRVEQPTSRGSLSPCAANLVTRNTGARSQADCVAPAGFALTSPVSGATPCRAAEYAPALNRLARCLRCQSGLEEPPNSNLTDGQRASKRAVCKIPPGRYSSQGLIRTCPQGFYRERYANFDAPEGTLCLPCNPGITTEAAGAGFEYLCNRVVLGHGIDSIYNVSGSASVPALPLSNTSGLPNATMCGIGFYSLGGWCAQCPSGTATRAMGATTVEECVVPPGYYLAAGAMLKCEAGAFREGWLGFTDPRATSCTPCGPGISSEPRDLDEHPLAANGSLVRATSTSCYIEAGMGMIAQGQNKYSGMECPINAYGASGKVYGLTAAPCKPCPRNMITDGQTQVNNSDACINDDGFGYASEGASRCAPGFYSAKGSRRPCLMCPAGRSTMDVAAMQRTMSDCRAMLGFGIVGSGDASTGGAVPCGDAFDPDVSGLDSAELAAFAVLECPLGYYNGEFSVGAKCLACPEGSTTQAPGSTNITDCNVCVAGYGKPAGAASPCSLCPQGSHQPGGLTECQACPSVSFYPPVDGAGPVWISNSTTLFQGAYGVEACVPQHSQLSPEAGQAYFAEESPMQALLTSVQQPDLGSCLATCAPDSCCLAQYNNASGVCKTATLVPTQADAVVGGHLLLYKLPPSTLGSASSINQGPAQEQQQGPVVSGKMMSSGYYAVCDIPAGSSATWVAGAGSKLGPDARTFSAAAGAMWDNGTTLTACRARCDDSNVCWGFIWDASSSACLYRGGVDALSTRSFFVLPSTVDLDSLSWAEPTSGGEGGPSTACSVVVPDNGRAGVLPGNTSLNGNSTVEILQGNATTGNTTGNTTELPQEGALPGLPQEGSPLVPPQEGDLPVPPQEGALPTEPGLVGNSTSGSTSNTTGSSNTTTVGGNTTGSSNTTVIAGNTTVSSNTTALTGNTTADGGNTTGSSNNSLAVCPEPPAPPANSTWPTNCNNAANGTRCVAFCTPGWTGSPYRTCSDGVWSDVAGNCTVPAVSPIITTVAGIYQNQTPNFIITYSPYKGYPQLLGDGGLATAAPLGNPWDVVQDESGNLYFVDFWVGVVRRVDNRTGVMTTIAGNNTLKAFTGDGGPASKAVFKEPSGLALWQGCLYVADSNNGAIRRINLTTNIITTVAGSGTVGYSGDGGPATSARLNQPRAVAIDPRNGDILIAEYAAPRVRRVSAVTGIITTVAGNGTLGTGRNKDWGMGGLANATAIAVPIGITVDAAGNVYFACDIGSVVQKIDTAGRISIVTGKLTNTNYTGDKGPADNATLWNPTDVKLDAAGNIFIADPYNRVVRRIDAETGIINTIAGTGLKPLSGPALPSGNGGHPIRGQIGGAGSAGGTMRLFLGPFGDMFVAESGNFDVRKITLYQTLR